MRLSPFSLAVVTLTFATTAEASPRRAKGIVNAYKDLAFIVHCERDMAHAPTAGHSSMKFTDNAEACSQEVKSRLEGGEAGSTMVKLNAPTGGPREFQLSEVEASVCHALAEKAKTWDASVKSAREDAPAAVAAPYKAVGIGGDKLAFLIKRNGDFDFYGVGGTMLKTPEAIKNASILFTLSGGGSGEKWTLYRFQFSGDSLTGSTQQDFFNHPGAAAYH